MKAKQFRPYKIVLVEFPIQPLYALKYFLCRLEGTIASDAAVSYFVNTNGGKHPKAKDPSILYIAQTNQEEIRKSLDSFLHSVLGKALRPKQRTILKKLFVFCADSFYESETLRRK